MSRSFTRTNGGGGVQQIAVYPGGGSRPTEQQRQAADAVADDVAATPGTKENR